MNNLFPVEVLDAVNYSKYNFPFQISLQGCSVPYTPKCKGGEFNVFKGFYETGQFLSPIIISYGKKKIQKGQTFGRGIFLPHTSTIQNQRPAGVKKKICCATCSFLFACRR